MQNNQKIIRQISAEEQHELLKRMLGVSYMLCTMTRDVYSDFINEAKKVHPLAGNKKFNKSISNALVEMVNAQRHLHIDLDLNNSADNKKAFSDDYLEAKEYLEKFFEL